MDAPPSAGRGGAGSDVAARSGGGRGAGGPGVSDAPGGGAMNESFLLPSFGGSAAAMDPPPSHHSAASPHGAYAPAVHRGPLASTALSSSSSATPSSASSYRARNRQTHAFPASQDPPRSGSSGVKSNDTLQTTPTSSGDSSGPPSVGRHPSDIPAWVMSVRSTAGARRLGSRTSPRDAILLALDSISSGSVSPSALAPEESIPPIVSLLSASSVLASPDDSVAVVSALYVLASDDKHRDAILDNHGLEALTAVACGCGSPVNSQGVATRDAAAAAVAPPNQTSPSRPLWDAAVRTIAKLVVFSQTACRLALKGDGLAVLATAAVEGEPMDTRVRAAAGVAAISSWSGPRYAVEVLETHNVIPAMAGVLTEEDNRVAPNLRVAILDGLNVLAHRRRARVLLCERGCEEFISHAARKASVSGEHDVAARSTVVAGQMAGHSVDEFGFLIENGEDEMTTRDSGLSGVMRSSGTGEGMSPSDTGDDSAMCRQGTGLVALQTGLLQERGYALVNEGSGAVNASVSRPRGAQASASKDMSTLGEAGRAASSSDAMFITKGVDPDEDGPELSPLVGFTAATERALARGAGMKGKSTSQMAKDAKNDQVWENVLKNRPEDFERENDGLGRIRAYRDLAGVPIPSKLRAVVWPKLLDVEGLRARKPGLFDVLCKHGETHSLPEDIEHTIEADLTRTMPLHCLFWRNGAAPGIAALRRVLRAYAFHVPSVGYCQGMSSIAALILLNSQTEEDAFLMLVRFLSRYGFKNVFKPGFPQYKQWVDELREVIAARMPDLNALFDREGVMPELFLDKSIITCLTHNYPHRALVRVWDLMFLGGSPKIILKACLAVLVLSEKRMMSMDFEAIVNFLQRGFAEPGAGIVDDESVEQFLECARSVKLSTEPLPAPVPSTSPTSAQSSAVPRQSTTGAAKKSRGGCFPCFGGKRKDD